MSKKNLVFMLSTVCLFLISNVKLLFAKEIDLFAEIISKTGSSVIEYGVRVSFMTEGIEKHILKDTLKTIGTPTIKETY